MAVDQERARAVTFDPITATLERGRLQFFAAVIGETDPIYSDVAAARKAGYPDLLVPPTFLFGLELAVAEPFGYLAELGFDLRWVLHGEQSFTYHGLVYAGETVTLQPRIVDAYSKKGGALDFIVKRTEITRGTALVAEATSVTVVRHPGA